MGPGASDSRLLKRKIQRWRKVEWNQACQFWKVPFCGQKCMRRKDFRVGGRLKGEVLMVPPQASLVRKKRSWGRKELVPSGPFWGHEKSPVEACRQTSPSPKKALAAAADPSGCSRSHFATTTPTGARQGGGGLLEKR